MNPETELRLECLRLASIVTQANAESLVAEAEKIYQFVLDRGSPPKKAAA